MSIRDENLNIALADWLRDQATSILAADPKLAAEAEQFADALAAKDKPQKFSHVDDDAAYAVDSARRRHRYGPHSSGGLDPFNGL